MARYTETDKFGGEFGGSTTTATPTAAGTVKQMTNQAPAAAADVAALKTQFDALLTKLVASGQMAAP